MREEWEIKVIGEVSKIINGGTPKTSVKEYWEGDINWITPKDLGKLKGVYVSETPRKISKLGLQKSSARLFKENSIILSTRAPIGHLAINQVPMSTNQGCRGIVPNSNLNVNYLFYFLKLNIKLLNDLGTGTTFKELSTKALSSIKIPIPPLAEQKQIVAILDQAFEAIDQAKANIEKNIVNAKELFQSKLNAIFSHPSIGSGRLNEGWEEKTLEELGTLTSSKRIYKKEYVSEGIPFYRSKEIKELAHDKDISLELFITKERYYEIKAQFGIPQEGDILLTAVGTIGEMYVVKKNEPDFYFKDGNIMWLKNFSTLNSYYLKYALLCFVEQLKAMSHGSAYSALTIEKLKKYMISVPNLSKQESIVKNLDAVLKYHRELIKNYTMKLTALEELKKSILEKAFSGELTN